MIEQIEDRLKTSIYRLQSCLRSGKRRLRTINSPWFFLSVMRNPKRSRVPMKPKCHLSCILKAKYQLPTHTNNNW